MGISVEGREYNPAPRSPAQEAATFDITSPAGSRMWGEFADGDEHASYVVKASLAGRDQPCLFLTVRDGLDVFHAAKMLRALADVLEAQKSKTDDPFEGLEDA